MRAKRHGYTYFNVSDMEKLCDRGGILIDDLKKVIEQAFDKCNV